MRTVTTISLVLAAALANAGGVCAPSAAAEVPIELAQAGRDKARLDRKPADPKAEKKKISSTMITMELLTVGDGVAVKAREWMEVLAKMDVTLTVRPGRAAEKLEVTERKAGGTLRTVNVKGMLDNRGQLTFPDRTFSASDTGKLAAWLDELRTYGAQGNPDGRPVWGLTKEQFSMVHAALKKPLAFDPKEVEVGKALEKFDLPKELPLRFSTAAARILKDRAGSAQVGQSLEGITQGTALAVLLSDQGLAFRPRRLPDGTVELTATTAEEGGDVWPVGWPRQQSPPETAPALFDIKFIDLEDEPLDAILDAAAGVMGIPILIDRAAMEAKHIDLSEVKITHQRKRTTWVTALNSFTYKGKSKFEVLIDESGKPFLWVTPLAVPARAQKE